MYQSIDSRFKGRTYYVVSSTPSPTSSTAEMEGPSSGIVTQSVSTERHNPIIKRTHQKVPGKGKARGQLRGWPTFK